MQALLKCAIKFQGLIKFIGKMFHQIGAYKLIKITNFEKTLTKPSLDENSRNPNKIFGILKDHTNAVGIFLYQFSN